jgi:hypothetical protein
MLTLRKSMNQYYSEAEAARTLCITVDALRRILDEHIFDDAHPRPAVLEFTYAELLLLSVWAEPERGGNVVAMPSKT